MFAQTWREYWGLQSDPFACEDADKDLILSEIDLGAVHSGFDRLFGDPRAPSPGIVFGEKGSGKSGLRLMMRRRIAKHNEAHPEARVFDIEYIDFNGFIEEVGRSVRSKSKEPATAAGVIGHWEIADHLDGILSLTVSKLVDELVDARRESRPRAAKLTRKQQLDMQLLAAMYYRSPQRTADEAMAGLRAAIRAPRPGLGGAVGRWLLTLVGLGVAVLPFLAAYIPRAEDLPGLTDRPELWHGLGLTLALVPWLAHLFAANARSGRSRKAARSIRILPDETAPLLARALSGMSARERSEFVLPEDTSETTRYELLSRLLGLLDTLGYTGLYVLMDRVDEPTLLSDSDQWMREFVARILDIKLLQHPKLALKMFLPIEMEPLWRNAAPEQLKRMRLDKSNLIPELKWTGRELYEIANQRLRACIGADSRVTTLRDLFAEDLELDYALDTLNALGTPRYAFGFLSEVFLQYVKDLPDDLESENLTWRLPRPHFDVIRASWIDKAGILRRTLN